MIANLTNQANRRIVANEASEPRWRISPPLDGDIFVPGFRAQSCFCSGRAANTIPERGISSPVQPGSEPPASSGSSEALCKRHFNAGWRATMTTTTPIRTRLNEVLIDLELTHDRQEGLQGALRSVISELFEEGFDHPNLKALYYLTTTIRDEHKRAYGQIEKLRKVREAV